MRTIVFLILSQFALAQSFTDDSNQSDLRLMHQEGKLVSVRIAIGEPLRIFVAGREEAKLNLSELKLTVKRLNPYPGKVLKTTKNGDYFAVTEPMDLDRLTVLEVKTKVKNKEETFRFKIENNLN